MQADAANNALIITAPEPLYRELRRVIDLLDVRRAQVYVESLIAEVSAEKASEIGVQWQSIIGRNGDGAIGAARHQLRESVAPISSTSPRRTAARASCRRPVSTLAWRSASAAPTC